MAAQLYHREKKMTSENNSDSGFDALRELEAFEEAEREAQAEESKSLHTIRSRKPRPASPAKNGKPGPASPAKMGKTRLATLAKKRKPGPASPAKIGKPTARTASQKEGNVSESRREPGTKKIRMNPSAAIFIVLKYAIAAALMFIIASQLLADRPSKAAFSTVQSAVNKAADLTVMKEGDAQMVRRLYGLDSTAFDGIELYYPKTNMGADELILIRMKSTEQARSVKKALNERKTSQMNVFEGYAPAQYKTVRDGFLEVRGNYAVFVSGKNAKAVKTAFLKTI